MPKQGILHDYDLMANAEKSSHNVICAVCGREGTTFQWSDYSGEGMCTQCGCPYQLKWGSDKQKEEENYPYLSLKKEFISVAQEYWNEKHQFVCYGSMIGSQPGMAELILWLKVNHPEHLKKG